MQKYTDTSEMFFNETICKFLFASVQELFMTRLIAFYLPQYHPIPENDEWWGKGFTEWRNVAKAKPLFPGHYQPHLPADFGYYDLRVPETRAEQAIMAREYGIEAFCYYHYWFTGRRVLERPFNDILQSGEPDFPFCLCWANENWTRTWNGSDKHILLEQKYSHEDDLNHIKSLVPALRDQRYFRINGKPLLLIYRTEVLPDPAKTAEIWRTEAHKSGLGDLYLVRVESFKSGIDPQSIGFDAALEFAPDWRNMGAFKNRSRWQERLANFGMIPKVYFEQMIVEYPDLVSKMLAKPDAPYPRFHCVTPGFDNSARRKTEAAIFINSTPEFYENWLKNILIRTSSKFEGDERIVFINAWNEWGEGNHLEPDMKWGRAYLEATRRSLG
nr:glycoside hydrolase family 99-like domain-containing protein [Dechloromonas sp.]